MQRVNGFYGHIQRNNLRSIVMFLGFALACQFIGLAILVWPLMFIDPDYAPVFNFYGYLERYGILVFIGSFLLFAVRFFLHVKHVEQDLKFQLVSQTQEQRLWKIIEIQAIGAGIAMPQVGIIEDDARNAFACGMSEQTAVVVVTRGLLRTLDDEELEAVVAHEVSHIVNGDIRMLAVANVMLSTLFAIRKRNPFRIQGTKSFIAMIFLPGLLIMSLLSGLVTTMGMILGMLTRLLIASSREFIADAEAVRMTKNPAALISALRRIEGFSQITDLDETHDAMMIDGAVEGTYASHPTISERIAVLTKHAGAMALGAANRKDTRTFTDLGPSVNGAFGRRVQMPANGVSETKKGMVGRVISGSKVDAFGLTPTKRRIVIVIIAIPLLFQAFMLVSGWRPNPGKGFDQIGGPVVSNETIVVYPGDGKMVAYEMGQSDTRPKKIDAEASLRRLWPDVAARRERIGILRQMAPLEARCFGHGRYNAGDHRSNAFKKPDDVVVAKYVDGPKKIPGNEVEKFAAIRIKSILGVNNAFRADKANDGKSLNKALYEYFILRKTLIVATHRRFGDEGIEWMLNEYDSDIDNYVVAEIKKKVSKGVSIGGNEREGLDIALLIENPKDFIPCYARYDIEQANKAKTAAISNDVYQDSAKITAQ